MMKRVFALLGKRHTVLNSGKAYILWYPALHRFHHLCSVSLDKTDAAVWNGLFWVIIIYSFA